MAHTETHRVVFVKVMQRSMQEKAKEGFSTALLNSIASKALTNRGWSFEHVGIVEVDGTEGEHTYEMTFGVNFDHVSKTPGKTEFASILYTLYGRAMSPKFGNWKLVKVDGKEYAPPGTEDGISSNITAESVDYADCEIPEDWDEHFSHLYGLESKIGRVKRAIIAAINSNFVNRYSCVLVGPPGCGKSDVAESVMHALGEDAVWRIDATSVTQAGLYKMLNEAQILPRVIIFEEIEKASESALQPLLSILDQRGQISKNTARGDIERDTKCLGIATVNNYDLFCKMQAGAVESRFANTIFFGRPDHDTVVSVLIREIDKINGSHNWIKPALDYCESHGIEDLRKIIALTLCGGDDWMDGTYAAMMDDTSTPSK